MSAVRWLGLLVIVGCTPHSEASSQRTNVACSSPPHAHYAATELPSLVESTTYPEATWIALVARTR